MRRRILCAIAIALVAGCGQADPGEDPTPAPGPTPAEPTPSEPIPAGQANPRVAEVVATGLTTPWGIAFEESGSALVTERNTGHILRVDPDSPNHRVVSRVAKVPGVVAEGEGGLLGIAISPESGDVFVYATTAEDNRVLRYEYESGGYRLKPEPEAVLTGIPKGITHNGGRLAFGPDEYLYVTTGETGQAELSQDRQSLAGKILRITEDGEPAADNPDQDSPVWSLGHRNVQGLAFDDRGRLWASEFGASQSDELNLIEPGSNYGWPVFEGDSDDPQYVSPAATWSPAEASPSGLAWLGGWLWMATLRGNQLWRIGLDGEQVDSTRAYLKDEGRLRAVTAAPDGSLWVLTSNTDGRGDPGPDDDRILRLTLGR